MSSQVLATVKRAPLGKTLGREGMVHSLEIAVERYRNNKQWREVMSDSAPKDAGTIQVMLQRLNDIRLPQALDLKKKVDRGEKLDSYDMEFLEAVLEDASSAQHLITKHPELQPLVSQAGLALQRDHHQGARKRTEEGLKPWARKTQRRLTKESTGGKLSRKDYEEQLRKLHVELVKAQQWIKHKGLKVCVVFEGRDGAGKGGTIKAITDRVSPRVFRVVALQAPTEREKSQMYVQRYLPHLPAAGEVVIFDRSWYNRAGVERVLGLLRRGGRETLSAHRAGGREGDRRFRRDPAQVLARSKPGRADAAPRGAHEGRPQALEALAHGSQVVQPLVRLLACARRDVHRHRQRPRALVRGAQQRQAEGAPQHHLAPAGAHSLQGNETREDQAAEAAEARQLREPNYPYKYIKERY